MAHGGHETREEGGVHALADGVDFHAVKDVAEARHFVCRAKIPWFASPAEGLQDAPVATKFGGVKELGRIVLVR